MAKEKEKNSVNTSKKNQKEVKNGRRTTDKRKTKATEEKKKNKVSEPKKEKVIDVQEEVVEVEDINEEVDEDLDFITEEDDLDFIEEDDSSDFDDEDESLDSNEEDDDLDSDEVVEEDDDLDFDDLDFDVEDEKDEVIVKKVSPLPKKDKKDKKNSKNKIEHIEKIAKEKKKKAKTRTDSSFSRALLFLDKYRFPIYAFIAGVLITVFIAMLIWPDRIATLKDGTQPIVKVSGKTYTADNLYEKMKDYYSVSLLLDQIDNDLLTKIYPEDEAMTKKVQENAEYYLNMYKQYYNYTQEEFLEKNGFSSYDAFLDYLRLDYRRNKYLDEYVEKNLTDNEIQKYYDENVFGDINTQHILVEVKSGDDDKSDKLSDEDAKKLAEEIITKLNDGTSWETIQKDYKDKVTFEDLSYQSWDASLEESFMTALKGMEDNSFSKEPVKTSYGYHVIYRIDQKKKPSLKKTKDKIVEKLVANKKSADSNLLYKSLISLRNEKKIKFSDTVMKSKYETYCKQYK